MQWRLRRASLDDAGAAALVAGASFLPTFAGILSGPDIVAHTGAKSSPEAFHAWIADPAALVTLAEHPDGGAPVGYTLLTPPDLPIDPGPADIELRRIYTLPLAAGTGLGNALMSRALDDARNIGRARMLLGVLATNTRARAFYERQGFTLAGERRFLVGRTWHDDVVYARPL
jgi:diamine N-acetyltransferase